MFRIKWTGSVLALWSALQLAGCSDTTPTSVDHSTDPGGPGQGNAEAVVIDSLSDLTPGLPATVYGKNLDRVEHLTVAGITVSFQSYGKERGTFLVPGQESCAVDGQTLPVVANITTVAQGRLDVVEEIRLEVGESRILSKDNLSCLKLPGESEDYLLSMASLTGERAIDALMTLKIRGAGAAASPSGTSPSPSTPDYLARGLRMVDEVFADVQSTLPASSAALRSAPFDDYANAKVGDVLTFIDWGNGMAVLQAKQLEDLPTYEAVVIAANDKQLIVGDLRSSAAGRFTSSSVRQTFQAAAEAAARYAEPALRAVINPDLVIPQGAGGRMVSVVIDTNKGAWGGVRASDIENRIGASDIFLITLSTELLDFEPGHAASVIVHEAAHLADHLPKVTGGVMSCGWYAESLAETVVDMAARMATGREEQAPVHGNSIWSRNAFGPSLYGTQESPWGLPGSLGIGQLAAYDRGARILRYAQRKMDQHHFSGNGPTLHQQLMASVTSQDPNVVPIEDMVAPWSLDSIAQMADLSVRDLLEESMMADLTDDLVAQDAISRYGLPQVLEWDHAEDGYPMWAVVPRSAGIDRQITVAAGGYAYLYFLGDDAGRGQSLKAADLQAKDYHQIRLTRLR